MSSVLPSANMVGVVQGARTNMLSKGFTEVVKWNGVRLFYASDNIWAVPPGFKHWRGYTIRDKGVNASQTITSTSNAKVSAPG